MGRPKIAVEHRIWSKIRKRPNGCWEWIGAKNSGGYGSIKDSGKNRKTHRVMWEIQVGGLTPGLTLDHLCRNRTCCNPDHLEEVSLKENILRGEGVYAKNKRKTHCKSGHKFTEKNTYQRLTGQRACRKCQVVAKLRYTSR